MKLPSSSSSSSLSPSSSSSTPQFEPRTTKPLTAQQVQAQTQIQNNHEMKMKALTAISIFFIVLLILTGFIYYINPEDGKELWHTILPMLSAATTGFVGYIIGEKKTRN